MPLYDLAISGVFDDRFLACNALFKSVHYEIYAKMYVHHDFLTAEYDFFQELANDSITG